MNRLLASMIFGFLVGLLLTLVATGCTTTTTAVNFSPGERCWITDVGSFMCVSGELPVDMF